MYIIELVTSLMTLAPKLLLVFIVGVLLWLVILKHPWPSILMSFVSVIALHGFGVI